MVLRTLLVLSLIAVFVDKAASACVRCDQGPKFDPCSKVDCAPCPTNTTRKMSGARLDCCGTCGGGDGGDGDTGASDPCVYANCLTVQCPDGSDPVKSGPGDCCGSCPASDPCVDVNCLTVQCPDGSDPVKSGPGDCCGTCPALAIGSTSLVDSTTAQYEGATYTLPWSGTVNGKHQIQQSNFFDSPPAGFRCLWDFEGLGQDFSCNVKSETSSGILPSFYSHGNNGKVYNSINFSPDTQVVLDSPTWQRTDRQTVVAEYDMTQRTITWSVQVSGSEVYSETFTDQDINTDWMYQCQLSGGGDSGPYFKLYSWDVQG